MKRFRYIFLGVFLGLAAIGAARPILGQQSGTLVFEVKNYTSDAKLPKKIQKVMEHGGIGWGTLDNSVLISMVRENFVKADLQYFTRFGEQKTLEMKAGQYTITCIGYEFVSTWSLDVDKNLAKSAFINSDIVTFTVLPGKTTTLEISPVIVAKSVWVRLSSVTMFSPDLTVRVLEDGAPKGEDVVITRRTENSVAWNDYHGPLKF